MRSGFIVLGWAIAAGGASAGDCAPTWGQPVAVLSGPLAGLPSSAATGRERAAQFVALHERRLAALGRSDPRVFEPLLDAANALRDPSGAEIDDEAVALVTRAVGGLTAAVGVDDPTTLAARQMLAAMRFSNGGDPRQTIRDAEAIAAAYERRLCGPSPLSVGARRLQAAIEVRVDPLAAIATFRRVAEDQARLFGPDDSRTLDTRYSVATLLMLYGRLDESETAYRDLADAWMRRLRQAPDTVSTRAYLTASRSYLDVVFARGREAEAYSGRLSLLSTIGAMLGPDDPLAMEVQVALASGAAHRGAYDDALARLAVVERSGTLSRPYEIQILSIKAQVHQASGSPERAEAIYADYLRDRGRYDAEAVQAASMYAAILSRHGKPAAAEAVLQTALDRMDEPAMDFEQTRAGLERDLAVLRVRSDPAKAERLLNLEIARVRAADPAGRGRSVAMADLIADRGAARLMQREFEFAYRDASEAAALIASRSRTAAVTADERESQSSRRAFAYYLVDVVMAGWRWAHEP